VALEFANLSPTCPQFSPFLAFFGFLIHIEILSPRPTEVLIMPLVSHALRLMLNLWFRKVPRVGILTVRGL